MTKNLKFSLVWIDFCYFRDARRGFALPVFIVLRFGVDFLALPRRTIFRARVVFLSRTNFLGCLLCDDFFALVGRFIFLIVAFRLRETDLARGLRAADFPRGLVFALFVFFVAAVLVFLLPAESEAFLETDRLRLAAPVVGDCCLA